MSITNPVGTQVQHNQSVKLALGIAKEAIKLNSQPHVQNGETQRTSCSKKALYPFELSLQDQVGSARELSKVRPQQTWNRGMGSAFGAQPRLVPNPAVQNHRLRHVTCKTQPWKPRMSRVSLILPISTLLGKAGAGETLVSLLHLPLWVQTNESVTPFQYLNHQAFPPEPTPILSPSQPSPSFQRATIP